MILRSLPTSRPRPAEERILVAVLCFLMAPVGIAPITSFRLRDELE